MSLLIMAAARALGGGADVPMMLGTLPGNGPSGTAWFAGFIILMLGSGVGGIAYGAVFEALTRRADIMTGIVVALIPMALEGLIFGLVGSMHPQMPENMQSPGFFMSNHGTIGVIGFVASHLAFGAIVGWLYGPLSMQSAMSEELAQ